MKAVNIKINRRINPLGIDMTKPLISLGCSGGIFQTAYEIIAETDKGTVWNSGVIRSRRMNAAYEGTAASRQRLKLRIRLYDEKEESGEWSEAASFEYGFLNSEDWKADWITPEISETGYEAYDCRDAINSLAKSAFEQRKHKKGEIFKPHLPASCLEKSFTLTEVKSSRLYITALGLYEAHINGQRVGDYVLTPGCSNYNYEIPYQTYDITNLLKTGENKLSVLLGDGWYRSTSGVDGDRNLFGDKLALLCQLEADGKPVIVSDESWMAAKDGPLMQNDMQQGEVYDSTKSFFVWHKVKRCGGKIPSAMNGLPIKEKECFRGKIKTTPNGEQIVDFGQNIAGYVEFTLQGIKGAEIRLWHGETLDKDGNFTQENFQDRKRHKENGTYQLISYICKDGENHFKPHFTIMGFRYVKVETDLDISNAVFLAHAVYSDMEQTSFFECGSEDVNRLFQNSLWSLKGNFCDIPTDCPTRERAGWTGDAGLFVKTGLTLESCYPVYEKWLAQCRYGQYEDGRIANIAPPNKRPGFMTGLLSGSVGWGDACINIPYQMYLQSGDINVLKENYTMMKRWYSFLEKRARKTGIKNLFKKNPYKKYTLSTGMNYGEWCEPGSTPMAAMRSGNYDVACAYFAYSGKLLAEISSILGEDADAEHFRFVSEQAAKAFRFLYTENGDIVSERQCQYIRPIKFGLLSEEEAKSAANKLNELIIKCGYHLNTGFLTTPMICETLAEYGYADTAYKVLLQDTAPSWLYEIRQGATTVWETWEGDASLNHYAYGAIAGWLISGVCGIHYENGRIRIAPYPHKSLKYAKAKYDSPAGKITSEWEYVDDECRLTVEIPCNSDADIIIPGGEIKKVGSGKNEFRFKI